MKPELKPYQKSKSRKKHQTHQNKCQISANPSEFAFQITKTAVSQICQLVGFKSSQLCALEVLTRIATFYLQTVAKMAVLYCNASNRTQSNLLDLINALHDVHSIRGFVGAPMLHDIETNCLLKSGFPDKSTYNKCEENVCDTRRGDMVLWEHSDLGQSYDGIGNAIQEENRKGVSGGGGSLPMERKRVRFKIGKVESKGIGVTRLDMGKQVCGGKKRKVHWNTDANCVSDDTICSKKRR